MPITEEERGIIQEEVDWIRPYVESLFSFTQLKHQYREMIKGDPLKTHIVEKDVLQVFATPERPYAVRVQELKRDGTLERTGQLPMPVVALQLADIVPDPSRYVGGPVQLQLTSDKKQWYRTTYPQPYNFIFQLDIRTRWREGLSQMWSLLQQFQTKLDHGAAYVEVDMGPLGFQLLRVEVDGPQDTSDLEVGDNKERALRRTYTLTVNGWLIKPLDRVPSIWSVTLESIDIESGKTICDCELANAKECF